MKSTIKDDTTVTTAPTDEERLQALKAAAFDVRSEMDRLSTLYNNIMANIAQITAEANKA